MVISLAGGAVWTQATFDWPALADHNPQPEKPRRAAVDQEPSANSWEVCVCEKQVCELLTGEDSRAAEGCRRDTGRSSRPAMAGAGLDALLLLLFAITITSASLIESRAQSKQLQRAVRHRQVTVVVEGVRERMTGTPSPDPLLLINFPDIDTQFKVHLLEDSNTLKLTLAQNDIDSKFLEHLVIIRRFHLNIMHRA